MQRQLETGLGADLSGVRVHTDGELRPSRPLSGRGSIHTGNDIFFRDGAYNPSSSEGMHLLAHEATHTVQQSGVQWRNPAARYPSATLRTYEQAASAAADNVVSRTPAQRTATGDAAPVQRHASTEEEPPVQRAQANGSFAAVQRDTPYIGAATAAPAESPHLRPLHPQAPLPLLLLLRRLQAPRMPELCPRDAGATPAEGAVSDAAIDALDLEATAKVGATALKKAHSEITFTSGRRDWSEQANAMAHNIVELRRKWIEDTYSPSGARDKLQGWVNSNEKAVSEEDIAKGLKDTLDAMSTKEQGYISKHPTGEALSRRPRLLRQVKSPRRNAQ